jgi:hypothetical protein
VSTPRPEVAAVIAQAADAYQARYGTSPGQRRILRDLVRCRTAALGGHKQQCGQCGHEVISYNSCRNRHCPKCQGSARAGWLAARAADLLPVPYFHVVFTLPAPLGPLALQNQRLLYGLLFRAAAATLRTIARDPQQTRRQKDPNYVPRLRTAIVTARSAPAHERVVTTLRQWGIEVDEVFFLGGIEKRRILEEFQAHIFFDDTLEHIDAAAAGTPSVHVPAGVANEPTPDLIEEAYAELERRRQRPPT